MRVKYRIVFNLAAFSALAWGQMRYPAYASACRLAGIIVAWTFARDLWLARLHVTADDKGICLSGSQNAAFLWSEINRVQILHPSLPFLFNTLRLRAPVSRSGESPASAKRRAVRRVLIWSAELVICDSKREFSIPLAALHTEGALELIALIVLRLDATIRMLECPLMTPEPLLRHYRQQANSLFHNGEFQRAMALYIKTSQVWESLARVAERDFDWQCMSDCLINTGQYTRAVFILDGLLASCQGRSDRRGEAAARTSLAKIIWTLGDGLDEGIKHLDRARELHQRLNQPFFVAQMLTSMAANWERRYLLSGGEDALEQCRHLAEEGLRVIKPLINNDKDRAAVEKQRLLNTIAFTEYYQGRRPSEEATDSVQLKRSLETFIEARRAAPGTIIVSQHIIYARVLLDLSRLSPDHPDGTAAKQHIHAAMQKAHECVTHLAMSGSVNESIEVYKTRGDIFWEKQMWEQALRDYSKALELLEPRKYLLSRPGERATLRRRFEDIFPRLVEGSIKQAMKEPGMAKRWVDQAFAASEQFKASSLSDVSVSSLVLPHLSPETRARFERALNGQIAKSLPRDHNDTATWQQAFSKNWEGEDEFGQTWEQIVKETPSLDPIVRSRVCSRDELLEQLPDDDTCVVSFSLCEGGLAVIIASRRLPPEDSFLFLESINRRKLPEAMAEYKQKYEKYVTDQYVTDQADPSPWMKSIRKLVACIRKELFDSTAVGGRSLWSILAKVKPTRLIFVTEGFLSRLPLHSAVLEIPSVSFAPSCSVLLAASRRARSTPKKMLIVSNPTRDMPAMEHETRLIKDHARRAAIEVLSLEHEEATTAAILNSMPKVDWVQMGCHASSNFKDPWESCIKTAGMDSLTARRLLESGRIMAGSALLLDGCSSGAAPEDVAGEFTGLPAALLLAGFSVVVSTLWDVPQGLPVVLIDRFYERMLRNGEPVTRALQAALEEYRGMTPDEFRRYAKQKGIPAEVLVVDNAFFPPEHPWNWAAYIVWGAAWTADESVPSPTGVTSSHSFMTADDLRN